jgi:hypothetical protein
MLNEIDDGRVLTLENIAQYWSPLKWKFDLGGVTHTLRGHASDSHGSKSKFSEAFSQAGKIARLFKEVRGNLYLATQKELALPHEHALYEQNGNLCLVLPTGWVSEALWSMGIYRSATGLPRPYQFFRMVIGTSQGSMYLASAYPLETEKAKGAISYYRRRAHR